MACQAEAQVFTTMLSPLTENLSHFGSINVPAYDFDSSLEKV